MTGLFRCYDVLIYPDKNVLDLVDQSLLSRVHDYFQMTFPDLQLEEVHNVLPDYSVMRFISLHTHLLQYQRIISNTSFTIHSSTVAQLSRTIVSIYTQIHEHQVQVVSSWKKATSKSQLDEVKQV